MRQESLGCWKRSTKEGTVNETESKWQTARHASRSAAGESFGSQERWLSSQTSDQRTSCLELGRAWVQLHQKRPDSVLHSWGNSDPTSVAMYSANIQYTQLRRQCRVVNKLESQETNGICLFIKWYWTLIQPFKPPPNPLRSCSSRSTISQ